MADTAVARLRGILAATMTRTAIDQLLAQVAAEQLRAAPGRPTPRLIRDLVEGAAVQGQRCPERTRTSDGGTVACAKSAAHPGIWHRKGRHLWKVVLVDTRDQREDNHQAPGTPRTRPLHLVVEELRMALHVIATGDRDCSCRSADVAREALSVTTPRT